MVQLTTTEVDRKIGQRIQQKRKEQGYSAEKLSEFIDISQQQLSRYERGTNKINVAHLVAIAVFLDTPISYFFQDCFEQKGSDLDHYWQDLSEEEKSALVAFLAVVRKANI